MEQEKIPSTIEELLELKYDQMLETIHPSYSSDRHGQLPAYVLTDLLVSLLKDGEFAYVLEEKAADYMREHHMVRPTYEPTVSIRAIMDEFSRRKEKVYYTPEELEEILKHLGDEDAMYNSDYCQVGETPAVGELLEGHLASIEFREEHEEYFIDEIESLKSLSENYKDRLLYNWRVLCAIGTKEALDIVKDSFQYGPFAEQAVHLKDMKGCSSTYLGPLNSNISKNAQMLHKVFCLLKEIKEIYNPDKISQDNIIHGKIKCSLTDILSIPTLSDPNSSDYDLYGYIEWDRLNKVWTLHYGGTDGSTHKPYGSDVSLAEETPPLVEEYLKRKLDKMGIKVDLKMFEPLGKHNLETILGKISKKMEIAYHFELDDGRLVVLR